MSQRIKRAVGGSAVIAVTVLGTAAPALAAKHKPRRHRHGTATSQSSGSQETLLTGSTLTSASNAAVAANPGATVKDATTETDNSISGAAYEVHITKSDGSRATVIEDSSFNVLATQADPGGGGCHHGGPGGNGETPLTGSTLTSASNAAVAANPGATVKDATTETDSSLSGAAYEVHITKSDGSRATVIEDSSFNVLATQADQGGGGCHHGGPGGNGETPLTGSTLTSASNAAVAANPGATVKDATTETDSSLSGAAYEVHITKSDGSRATVIEDSSFNVLATQADQGGGGCHHGGPGGNGETPLTGST